MDTAPSYSEVLRRHALPEVLFARDIAFVLMIAEEDADNRARLGTFGPNFYVGGRVAVLKADFLDALAAVGEAESTSSKELLSARLRVVGGQVSDVP